MVSATHGRKISTVTMRNNVEGVDHVGSAWHWAWIMRNPDMQNNCEPWPPRGSDLERSMHEVAIANAVLLGGEFIVYPQGEHSWRFTSQVNTSDRAMSADSYDSQGSAAAAYLAYHGFWLGYSHQKEEWELIRI